MSKSSNGDVGCLGCVLGAGGVILVLVLDCLKWSAIRRSDRVGAFVWFWLTLLYAGVALVLLTDPLATGLDKGLVATALAAHGVWGLSLIRPIGKHRAFSLLAHGALAAAGLATAGALLGADQTDRGLDWILRLGITDLTPHHGALLLMLLAVGLSLLHTDRWRGPWFNSRRALVLVPDGALTLLTWGAVLLGLWGTYEYTVGETRGWFVPELLGASFAGVIIYLIMMLVIGLAHLTEDPVSARTLAEIPLARVLRRHRRRLQITRKPGLLKLWDQVLPTTGLVALLFPTVVLAWTVQSPWVLVPGAVVACALIPLAVLVAYRHKAPFGPRIIDLNKRTQVASYLSGLQWTGERLELDHWQILDYDADKLKSLGEGVIQSGFFRDIVALDPAHIKHIGFRTVQPQASPEDPAPRDTPPDNDGHAGGDAEAEKKPIERNWRLEIVYRETTLNMEIPSEARSPEQRLEMMADLWFLGRVIGCPVRLPHRLIADTRALRTLSDKIVREFRAFSRTATDETKKPATWVHRPDPQTGAHWWLIPGPPRIVVGLWWLALAGIVGLGELGYAAAQTLPGVEWFDTTGLLIRVLLLGGYAAAFLRAWLLYRDPDVYALRVDEDGINIHGQAIPWEDIIDINALPALDFPLAIVTQHNKLIGIPVSMPEQDQLALATMIGVASHRYSEPLDSPDTVA